MSPIEADRSGDQSSGASDALRNLLFDVAAESHRRIIDCVDAAAEGIQTTNSLRVLGSLEGTEENLRVIRSCMVLVRDHLPPASK